jgi:hypothetical protein
VLIRLRYVRNTVLETVRENVLEGARDRIYQHTFCVESLLGCSCRTSNCPPKTAYQFKPRSPCRNTANKDGCDNTHSLLMCSTSHHLLQKVIFPQLIKKVPTFYANRRFITVSTTECHLSLSWASSIQSTTQSLIYGLHNMGHPVTLCYAHLRSSVGTATTLRAGRYGDRIPTEARFSAPVQTDPGVRPASRRMGTRSLPVV